MLKDLFNDISTIFFTYNVGVRQGENLSFFLFALWINDLEYIVQNVLNKFIPRIFNSNLIMPLWYWKLNITFFSLYHVTVKSCDQFLQKLYMKHNV